MHVVNRVLDSKVNLSNPSAHLVNGLIICEIFIWLIFEFNIYPVELSNRLVFKLDHP